MKKALNAPVEDLNDDHAPELDLMLQNEQVTDRQLAETLLDAFEVQLCQSAFNIFNDPGQARCAVFLTLAQGIANRYQFWGNQPLFDWLEHFISRSTNAEKGSEEVIWNELDRDAQVDEIVKEADRLRQIKHTHNSRVTLILIGMVVVGVLGVLGWIAWPEIKLAFPQKKEIVHNYQYYVQEGDTLENIASRAGVPQQSIIDSNQYFDFSKGAFPYVHAILVPEAKPTSSPLDYFRDRWPLARPASELGLQSTSEEVRLRILENTNYWRFMFADTWYAFYYAPGFVGTLYQGRFLWWLKTTEQSRLDILDANDRVVNRMFTQGDRRFTILPGFPGEDGSVSLNFNSPNDPSQLNILMFCNIRLYDAKTNFVPVGNEAVAGRQALVVDYFNADGQRSSRLWVDQSLGVILACRIYQGKDRQDPAFDFVILKVELDEVYGPEVFDPFSNLRVDSPSASIDEMMAYHINPRLQYGPIPSIPETKVQPPAGFDPAKGRLALQWPNNNAPGSIEGDLNSQPQVTVYVDNYYLGDFPLPPEDQNFSFCRRSPNGKIVVIGANRGEDDPVVFLFWFSLDHIDEIQSVNGQERYFTNSVAFSPDSSHLALTLCNGYRSDCWITILDLTSGVGQTFDASQVNVNWIIWSPDGEQLAIIGVGSSGASDYKLYIYDGIHDLSKMRLVYRGAFDINTYRPASDAPIQQWGVDLKELMNNQAGCAAP